MTTITQNLTSIRYRLGVFDHPLFRFDAGEHAYWLGSEKLTNFSSWIDDYKAPFDEQAQAARTAQRRGITAQEVLDEWERNRWVGTMTHAFIENYYKAGMPAILPALHEDADVAARCRCFLALRDGRLKDFEPVAMELQAFHELTGICGTIDFLAWHVPTQTLWVLDWKTNGTFTTDADRSWSMFSPPFADLAENKLNLYSLQASWYRLILDEAGIETAGAVLVHLPPGGQPGVLHKAKDFTARLRELLF